MSKFLLDLLLGPQKSASREISYFELLEILQGFFVNSLSVVLSCTFRWGTHDVNCEFLK